MAVAVKIYLHHPLGRRPSVHRVELSEPYVLSDLVDKLGRTAEGSTVRNLRWRDAEKDLVVLKSDDDLLLAIDHVRSENLELLRVHADVDFSVRHSVVGKAERTAEKEGVQCEHRSEDASQEISGGEVVENSTSANVAQGKKAKWPERELPNGGRYSGYIRTAGADGQTVERELTLEEAKEILGHPSVFGHFEPMLSWPSYHQRVLPLSLGGYSPQLYLPFYF